MTNLKKQKIINKKMTLIKKLIISKPLKLLGAP